MPTSVTLLTLYNLVKLISSKDLRKRTKSFKYSLDNGSSMSVMMKEDSSYLNNAVVCKSKKSLFKELTCMVMQSSNYIKTLPEVDLSQLDAKKVSLQNKVFGSTSAWVNHNRKFFGLVCCWPVTYRNQDHYIWHGRDPHPQNWRLRQVPTSRYICWDPYRR